MENFENKTEETPVVVEEVAPEMNRAIHGSTMESTAEVVEEPKVEEPKVEVPVVEEPKIETPVAKNENNSTEDIAIYTLRSLTFPGGVTVPKGYSFVSKKKYDKIANHKAVRLASKDEVKTYLK